MWQLLQYARVLCAMGYTPTNACGILRMLCNNDRAALRELVAVDVQLGHGIGTALCRF